MSLNDEKIKDVNLKISAETKGILKLGKKKEFII